MRYLWQQPLRMRSEPLVDFLGHEPHTPVDDTIDATLRRIGCLPANATADRTGSPTATSQPLQGGAG